MEVNAASGFGDEDVQLELVGQVGGRQRRDVKWGNDVVRSAGGGDGFYSNI